MTKAWDIVAYTYRADTYCPVCIVEQFNNRGDCLDAQPAGFDTEDYLARVATILGIDRMVEWSFDSGDFPKVVFSSMIEDVEYCGECHGEIR